MSVTLQCPNQDCPFQRKFKRPAEYRAGFETCNDCGSTLIAAPAPAPTHADARKERAPLNLPYRRLGVTLLGPLVVVLCRWWVPGVDFEALGPLANLGSEMTSLTLGAVGLTPFLTAFALVELGCALVPSWRKLRLHPAGRVRLSWWTTRVAILLLIGEALTLARWLTSVGRFEDYEFGYGFPLYQESVPFPFPVLVASFVGASLVQAWLATLISRYGIGNGWGVMVASHLLLALEQPIVATWRAMEHELMSMPEALILLGVLAAAVVWVHRWVDVSRGRYPTGGLYAAMMASQFVAAVFSMFALLGFDELSARGAGLLEWGGLLLCIPFAVGASFLLNQPSKVAEVATGLNPRLGVAEVRRQIRIAFPRQAALTVVICGALVLVPVLLGATMAPPTEALGQLTSTSLLLHTVWLASLAFDFLDEWALFRGADRWVSAWPVHQVYALPYCVQRLAAANIPTHVRGKRFRALFPFFESYVPMELLVREAELSRAQDILAQALSAPTSDAVSSHPSPAPTPS